jgi:hypothetical protein
VAAPVRKTTPNTGRSIRANARGKRYVLHRYTTKTGKPGARPNYMRVQELLKKYPNL